MYLLENFVATPLVGDAQLRIRDQFGFVKRVIKKNTVANTKVVDNTVIITFISSSNPLVLDFSTNAEAKSAIIKFNNFYSKINLPSNDNYNDVITVGSVRYTDLRTELGALAVFSMLSTSVPHLYINPTSILSLERDGKSVYITNNAGKMIELNFTTLYDAKQGFSRINWLKQEPERILTVSYPTPDNIPPIANWKSTRNYLEFEYIPLSEASTRSSIINYFLHNITDERDGVIPIDSNDIVTITDEDDLPVTGVTAVSETQYKFQVAAYDAASNLLNEYFHFKVVNELPDLTPPIFIYRFGGPSTGPLHLTGDKGPSGEPFNPLIPILNINYTSTTITKDDLADIINENAISNVLDPPSTNLGTIGADNIKIFVNDEPLHSGDGIDEINSQGIYRCLITVKDDSNNESSTNIYLNVS